MSTGLSPTARTSHNAPPRSVRVAPCRPRLRFARARPETPSYLRTRPVRKRHEHLEPSLPPWADCQASPGLVDAGNWAVSASWAVPVTAVSGLYYARFAREDTGGGSAAYFVVRDDDNHSDLLFQTSDSTWQAYNAWGGNSLYVYGGS